MLTRKSLLATVLAVPMMLAAPAHAAMPEPVDAPASLEDAPAVASADEMSQWTLIDFSGAGEITLKAEPYALGDDVAVLSNGEVLETGTVETVTGQANFVRARSTAGEGWINTAFASWSWPKSPLLTRTVTLHQGGTVYTTPHEEYRAELGTVEPGTEVTAGAIVAFPCGGFFASDCLQVPVETTEGIGWVDAAAIGAGTALDGAPAVVEPAADESTGEPTAAAPVADTPVPAPESVEEDGPAFPLWLIPAALVALIGAWLMFGKRKGKPAEAEADTEAPAVFQDDDDEDFDPFADAEPVDDAQPEPQVVQAAEPELDSKLEPEAAGMTADQVEPEPDQDDVEWGDEPVRPRSRPINSELESF